MFSHVLNLLQGSTTFATEPISPPLFPPGFVPNDAQTTGSNSSTSSESAPPSPPPEELEHEALLRSGTPSVPSQYRELHSALQSGWFTEYLDTRIRGLQPPSNEPSLTDPSHPVQLNTAAYWPKTDGIYVSVFKQKPNFLFLRYADKSIHLGS